MNVDTDIKKTDDGTASKKTCRLSIYALGIAVTAIILVLVDFLFGVILTSTIPSEYYRLIEGIPSIVGVLLSNLSFLLGIIALIIIAFNRNKVKGNRYALLAILLSTPFLLLTASRIYVARGRAEQKKTGDGRNIAMRIVEYAKNNDDYLPDANQWCDLLIEYHNQLPKDRFKYNPVKYKFKYDSSKEGICNYAFNQNLSGLRLKDISYNTVLIFESAGRWNLSGTEELFKKTHEKRQYVYIYTKVTETGHGFPSEIYIKSADYENAIWKPSHMDFN